MSNRGRFASGIALGAMLTAVVMSFIAERRVESVGTTSGASRNIENVPTSTQTDSPADAFGGDAPIGQQRRLTEIDRELIRAKEAGRAVLDADIPVVAGLQSQVLGERLSWAMKQAGPGYLDYFESQGIDAGTVDELMLHIATIYEAKFIVDNAETQLRNARRAYQNYLEGTLGAEGYQDYLDREARELSETQLQSIAQSSPGAFQNVDDATRERILDMIDELNLFSFSSLQNSTGVLDDGVIRGSAKSNLPVLLQLRADLSDGMSLFVERSTTEGVPEPLRSEISKFYEAALNDYTRRIEAIAGTGRFLEEIEATNAATAALEARKAGKRP